MRMSQDDKLRFWAFRSLFKHGSGTYLERFVRAIQATRDDVWDRMRARPDYQAEWDSLAAAQRHRRLQVHDAQR